jgi:hypothetical protein
MNFKEFIQDESTNRSWINEEHICVYVRRSKRFIDGQLKDCLDLANVSVDEEERGKGIFSKFLIHFEKEAVNLNRTVYLENVLEKRLQKHLMEVKNYKLLNFHCEVATFIKT